jgi:hypothetical protein
MVKSIDTIFYFCALLNNNLFEQPNNCIPVYINQTTVNNLITNEKMYDLNKTLESIFIKEE